MAKDIVEAVASEEVAPTSYSTETPAAKAAPAKSRGPLTTPGAGLGRRKQAIARVRLVPGTGTIKVTAANLPTTSQTSFTSS